MVQDSAQQTSKRPREGHETAPSAFGAPPRRCQHPLNTLCFLLVLLPCRHFASNGPTGPQDGSNVTPGGLQEGPRRLQNGSKKRQNAPQGRPHRAPKGHVSASANPHFSDAPREHRKMWIHIFDAECGSTFSTQNVDSTNKNVDPHFPWILLGAETHPHFQN